MSSGRYRVKIRPGYENVSLGGTTKSYDAGEEVEIDLAEYQRVIAGAGVVFDVLTAPSDFGTLVPSPTGVAATDTAAIQAAINQSGHAVLAPGRYELTPAGLVLTSNTILSGAGENFTTLHQASTTGSALTGVDLSHVAVRDLRLLGPGPYTGTGYGINFTLSGTAGNATFYVELSNIRVEEFGMDGVQLATPIVSKLDRVQAFKNGRHGIHLTSTGQADGTSSSLIACFSAGNHGAGIRLKQQAYSTLSACAGDANGIGYEYDTCVGITESGCGTEEPYDFSAFQAGYTGMSRKIFNTKITLNSPYMIGNIYRSMWVTNGSEVVANNLFEGSPGNPDAPVNTPTYSVDVDAGCKVTLNNHSVVTALRTAASTTTVMPDALASAGGGSAPAPLITGQEVTMDPLGSAATSMGGSGSLRLTYFTAAVGGTFTKLRTLTSTPAAGATPTLAKMGIYSVASNGNLTLLAGTANDTTLWSATNTAYERTTTTSYTLVAGQRYALGVLVVTAAAIPSLVGKSSVGSAAANAELARAPRRTGSIGSQTDLPSAPTFDLVADTATAIYGACA